MEKTSNCSMFGDAFGCFFAGVGATCGRLLGKSVGHVWEVFEWIVRGFKIVVGKVFRGKKDCKKPKTYYINM